MSPSDHVIIHTDGACKGNPGPGGWGAVLQAGGGHEKELWGGERNTTNNRMELMAAIAALEALTEPCQVALHTDSRYVQQGISEWLPNWVRRGWKTAAGAPVVSLGFQDQVGARGADHRSDVLELRVHLSCRQVGSPAGDRFEFVERAARVAQAPAGELRDGDVEDGDERVALAPGDAVYVGGGVREVVLAGAGEAFVAHPGALVEA